MHNLQAASLKTIWNNCLHCVHNDPKKVRIGTLILEVKKLSDSPLTDLQAIQELANNLSTTSDPQLAPLAQRLVTWDHFGTLDFGTRTKLVTAANRLGGGKIPKQAFQIREFFRTIVRFAAKHSQVSPQFREILLERERMIAEAINKDPFDKAAKEALQEALEPILPKKYECTSTENAINSWLESVKKDPIIIAKLAQTIEEKREPAAAAPTQKKEPAPLEKEEPVEDIKTIISKQNMNNVERFFKKNKSAVTEPNKLQTPSSPVMQLLTETLKTAIKARQEQTGAATEDIGDKFRESPIAQFTQKVATSFKSNFEISNECRNELAKMLPAKANPRSWQSDCWTALTGEDLTTTTMIQADQEENQQPEPQTPSPQERNQPDSQKARPELTHLTRSRAKPPKGRQKPHTLIHNPKVSSESTQEQPPAHTSKKPPSSQALRLPGLGESVHLKPVTPRTGQKQPPNK